MGTSKERIQLVDELHAPARRNFPRRPVVTRGYDDLWQADLVEMRAYATRNRGHNYILTIIDTFSKYAWAVPVKTKSGRDVTEAFATVLRRSGRCPRNLQTDMGKEFYNVEFQRVTKTRGIKHYSTYSVMKASIVEHFNRTLKNLMWKQFSLNASYRWLDLLPTLVHTYNHRKHRTINARPVDVTSAIRLPFVVSSSSSSLDIDQRRRKHAKFHVGDKVRVSKFKTIFEKGYTPNWSTEVFEITAVQRTRPVTYILRDSAGEPISGGFYEHELHSVANPNVYLIEKIIRRKGNQVYVKWLGFDSSKNSWIQVKDIL